MTTFDRLETAILTALQEVGRLSIVDLGERVGLSPTACQRRVRVLEDDGVIEGYRAVLAPASIGLGVQAFVTVSIERQSTDVVAAFELAIARLPAAGCRLCGPDMPSPAGSILCCMCTCATWTRSAISRSAR